MQIEASGNIDPTDFSVSSYFRSARYRQNVMRCQSQPVSTEIALLGELVP